MRRFLYCLPLFVVCACRGTRPSSFAEEAGPLVLVKEAHLPNSEPWYTRFATHAWFDVRTAEGGEWQRVEIISPHSGVNIDAISADVALADQRWNQRRVRVRGVLRGERAEVAAASILAQAAAYDDERYQAVPGPNSNTFVAELTDNAPHLRTTMHHNAVGKDHLSPIGIARTPSKTGGRLDTPWIGGALALQEGVELHLAGLQFGIGIWPPRVCLPFLPEIGPAVPANGR